MPSREEGVMKTAEVERHYGSAGIAERVLAAFRAATGPNAPGTPEGLAPFDHFHGRGVAATHELAAPLALRPGECLLDVGSGVRRAAPRSHPHRSRLRRRRLLHRPSRAHDL